MQITAPSLFASLRIFTLSAVWGLALLEGAPSLAGETVPPLTDRLPERPAWESVLTPGLERLAEAPASPDAALNAKGVTYGSAMSRKARLKRLGSAGKPVWWRLNVQWPDGAAEQEPWPLALDVDEVRVIQKTWCNGSPLPEWNMRDMGDLWSSGEGAMVLPLAPQQSGTVIIQALEMPHLYENGFGGVRLRPARLNELLNLERINGSQRVKITNRGPLPISFELHLRYEDYFGAPLCAKDQPMTLEPGTSAEVDASPGAEIAAEALYKTRLWATVGQRATFDHWIVQDGQRTIRNRPHVQRLAKGWEFVAIPEPHEKCPPPASGWKQTELPHLPSDAEYTSHWFWYRTRLNIPKDWKEDRFEIMLPGVIGYEAKIFIDGKFLKTLAGWEVPGRVMLPDSVKAGTEHELCIGLTDYIVGLAPGVKPPAKGPMSAQARATLAPMTSTVPFRMAFDSVPELVAVPSIRTDWAFVRTTVGKEAKTVATALELRNDRSSEASVTVHAEVFMAGASVLDLGSKPVKLASGTLTKLDLEKAWANPELWSPENPKLYEMRITLLDANGKTLDTLRERFGFRQFAIEGDHFTLNGERINLLGGSHVSVPALSWPVRPHPYRLMRYFATPAPSGFIRGIETAHLADEMGYLLKAENITVNAHHMDNYAWHNPLLWERLYSQIAAMARSQINHPANVIYDIGNEIIFKGPGEAQQMGELFSRIRELDPTRLVTVGGSLPFPSDAEIYDFHDWGRWYNRSDYFYYHPEERPSYFKTAGLFNHRPEGEAVEDWNVDLTGMSGSALKPGVGTKLFHHESKPIVFSEGHYYESEIPIGLFGADAWVALPPRQNWTPWGTVHNLNMLACRSLSLVNVRQAGLPSSMIHVDRGIGRHALPLASFSWNRDDRFLSGDRLATRYGIHYDLSTASQFTAQYRLFDGSKCLGESGTTRWMKPGEIAFADLDFEVPAVSHDTTLNLEVRVWSSASSGWYYETVPYTILTRPAVHIPEGKTLSVYDPEQAVAPFLKAEGVQFTLLASLGAWQSVSNRALMVGSEGLNHAAKEELAALQKKVEAGGSLVVLDHRNLPMFLQRRLNQVNDTPNCAARQWDASPLLSGILNEDLRAWQTRERDQVVAWNPIGIPATGRFRAHALTRQSTPLLELPIGAGRVLFSQFNLRDALGCDPAAARLTANLVSWAVGDSAFESRPTLLVSSHKPFVSALQGRFGLDTPVSAQPSSKELKAARVIVASGTEAAARTALDGAEIADRLKQGGTLLLIGLDEAGARWLSEWTHKEIRLESYPHAYALLTGTNAVTVGLQSGDFFVDGPVDSVPRWLPIKDNGSCTGVLRLSGSGVHNLTEPAYLAEVPVGKGKVVVSLVRSLEFPIPGLVRVLSTVLGNLGATLNPDGVAQKQEQTRWSYAPIDLTRFANWPIQDNDGPNVRRGWHLGGADNDMREFPVGKQNLRGVDYLIADPKANQGNAVIAIASAGAQIHEPPNEVKGIPVGRKAERLYFLHNAAWGMPNFVYRVYYAEDRAKWIPGKPDPFVDVPVKPHENIEDWWFAGKVDKGQMFMAGASVAWLGQTARLRISDPDYRIGVYQMVWDNPYPEKTIESVDILCTGGVGNVFVFGITAASRSSGMPKPPLEKVLPKGVNAAQVQEQVQFERYGAVILKNGVVATVYDGEGNPLMQSNGWDVQTIMTCEGQKTLFGSLGGQPDQTPKFTAGKADNSERILEFEGGEAPSKSPLQWRQKLIFTPASIRCEYEYTPLRLPAEESSKVSVNFGLRWLGPCVSKDPKPNQVPVMVQTPSGMGSLDFDKRYVRWYQGYSADGKGVSLSSPPKDAPPYTLGRTETIWWQLDVP